jgi:hypothetical protein
MQLVPLHPELAAAYVEHDTYAMVGLYKLNAVDPALESARFQPLSV